MKQLVFNRRPTAAPPGARLAPFGTEVPRVRHFEARRTARAWFTAALELVVSIAVVLFFALCSLVQGGRETWP